jgi:hypothetical protein
MRQILEKSLEHGVSTFHRFINCKTTYDTIKWEKLLEALKAFKISQKLSSFVYVQNIQITTPSI